MYSGVEIDEILSDNRHLHVRSSDLICKLSDAREALILISSCQDRGFGIDYAKGCADQALGDTSARCDTPSIRQAAALIGKAPSTVQRWKRTNPELYRAVMEYAEKRREEGSDGI